MISRYIVPLAALCATACAAHDDEASATSAVTSADDCRPGRDLTFTVVASQTGGNSDPNRVTAMQAALAEVNALGGVRGHKIALRAIDNASSEDQARTIIEDLLADDPPSVLFGTHTSNVLPLVQLATPERIFVFGAGSSLPNVVDNTTAEGASYFARTTPAGDLLAQRLAQLTFDDGATQVGIIYVADTVQTRYKDDFVAKFTALGGTLLPDAVRGIDPASTATSFADVLASAVAGALPVRNRPAVVIIASAAQFKILLNDATVTNTAVQWYAQHNVQSGDALSVNPAAAVGLRGVRAAPGDAAHFDHYVASLAATAPGLNPSGTAYANMYDEVMLFALTAERAGFSANGLRRAIRSVSNAGAYRPKLGPERLAEAFAAVRAGLAIDFDGASGSLELDERGDVGGRFEEFHVEGSQFVSGGPL